MAVWPTMDNPALMTSVQTIRIGSRLHARHFKLTLAGWN